MTENVYQCAECGHLHFLGAKDGYCECPIEGCGCEGQEWAANDRALAQRLADVAGDTCTPICSTCEESLFAAEAEIIERLGISPDETEQGLTQVAVEQIEAWVSEKIGRPWSYGPRYGEPDPYAAVRP